MSNRSSALHSVTWLGWAIAATATVQLAPNPLYVAIVLAVVALVVEAHRPRDRSGRGLGPLLVIAVVFALVRVALVLFTTKTGGSVIVTVPEATLPRLLGGFSVGGALEWPVLWTALAEGFVVIGVMAVFGGFNAVASHHELLQAMPRAFHEPGLVVTVALAFVPSTIAAVATVREADQARTGGRVVRRGRAVRLVIPVLETGLERAIFLAESMDSRGFGRGRATAGQRLSGWLGLGCLLSLSGAMIALVGRHSGVATILGAIGVASLIVAVVSGSRGGAGTRYRTRPLGRSDLLVLGLSAAAPLGIGVLSAMGDASLRWSGAEMEFPAFHLPVVVGLALLAVPALIPAAADPVPSPADLASTQRLATR